MHALSLAPLADLRVEAALRDFVERAAAGDCPPRLAAALRHAVFPGGARLRPRLALATADACGGSSDATPFAAALELAHCASLVHDDMPCFDDAATRRGRPSVHRAYGEAAALLVGDALIVLAFEAVASTRSVIELTNILAGALGAARGIIGGQGWELEPEVSVHRYHRAKTAALFEAATAGGATAAGHDEETWRVVGRKLGEAYQLADDLADVHGDAVLLGKPTGVDAALDKPNAVRSLGAERTRHLMRTALEHALDLVPTCPGRDRFRSWIAEQTSSFAGR
jgi:geranylgeranyl diphosphate synthase type II